MGKKRKITAKQVQAHEDKPYIPQVEVSHEIDEDDSGDDGLTIRQRLFVQAITGPALGNATRAAELAGYKSDNRLALKQTAAETLAKPYIQEAIAHALAKKRLTPEWAKQQLVDMARADMSNFVTVDVDGASRLDFRKAADLGALSQIKEYNEEVIQVGDSDIKTVKRKIKIHDRTQALNTLLRLHGLIRDVQAASNVNELLTPDPALAAAQPPPGSVPCVEAPGEVQDDPCGPEKRQDGDIRKA